MKNCETKQTFQAFFYPQSRAFSSCPALRFAHNAMKSSPLQIVDTMENEQAVYHFRMVRSIAKRILSEREEAKYAKQVLLKRSKKNAFSLLDFLDASDNDNPEVAAYYSEFNGSMDGSEYKALLSAIARRGRQAFSAKSARGKFKKLEAASIELQNDTDFEMALLEHTTILRSDMFCTHKIDVCDRCTVCREPK